MEWLWMVRHAAQFLKGTTESAVRQHYIPFCKEHTASYTFYGLQPALSTTLRHSNMTIFHWMITTTTTKTWRTRESKRHPREKNRQWSEYICKKRKTTLACRKDGSIHWTVAISVVSIVWSSMIRYVRGMIVKRELCKMCLIFTSLLTWQPCDQKMEKEKMNWIKKNKKTYTVLTRISHLFMNENAWQIKAIHMPSKRN